MGRSVAEIEKRLTSANGQKHLNDIVELFTLCEVSELRGIAEALQAIGRVLSHHRRLAMEAAADTRDAEAAVNKDLVAWLRRNGEAYHALLLQLAASGEPRAQVCALRLVFAAMSAELTEIRNSSQGSGSDFGRLFGLAAPERRIQEVVSKLLLAEKWSSQVADCLTTEFAAQYSDVRHYLLQHLRSCADQVSRISSRLVMPKVATPASSKGDDAENGDEEDASTPAAKKRRRMLGPFGDAALKQGRTHEEIFSRLFSLLREVPEPLPPKNKDDEEEDLEEEDILAPTGRPVGFYRREYRKLFQEAWLKLLGLRVPLGQCSPLLQLLPMKVMPHLSRPLMLSDFYLRAFHAGTNELSVLALSGLLHLLSAHGLGDPETLSSSCGEFYGQLYSLIKPETFRLQRRARFQRLAAAALASGLLPARFAAAFAKKCIHVAIACAEPGSIQWLMAVSYSLIQRHHSHCSFLLHWPENDERPIPTELTAGKDPWDGDAPLTEAVEQVSLSSLWELKLLLRHHLPAVSTLAKLFEKPFFKPTSRKLDPELFLDQSASKAYKGLIKAADKQVTRWKAKGERCPLSFKVEDDSEAIRVVGWAAALSTGQRRIGAGL
eukprot:TRINITY_DN65481_c0_g1_i1.p1 TRINITY_DN65481_c0_g1~~TRINITY_DN65481_c0_g1_i1.p1  ORF type:complete len:607 (-),score=124.98 TRINITY_DN65481_c0_g1_i1:60-1880(-)